MEFREHPDRIWGKLKQNTGVPTQAPANTDFEEGRRYQLLELAVGVIMAKLRPELQWTVTPVQGDDGIDFRGQKSYFEEEGLELAGYEVVAGQCKRAKDKINFQKELSYDVVRIARLAKPSHIVLAVAAPATKQQQTEVRAWFEDEFRRPFTLLGLEELDTLFRNHVSDLAPVFYECLNSKDSDELISYFSSGAQRHTNSPKITCRSPKTGATGIPFEIQLQFYASGLPNNSTSWRWTSPTISILDSTVATLRLISPTAGAKPGGKALKLKPWLKINERVRLIGYVTGRQSLGELAVLDDQGQILSKTQLGYIELADQNAPPFYWEPYKSHLDQFTRIWGQVLAGVPVGIAVTGAGGAGKTRFCEEMGFKVTEDSGRYIKMAFPKGMGGPHKIFADLILKLTEYDNILHSPAEAVQEFVACRNQSLANKLSPTIRRLFDFNGKAQKSETRNFEEDLLSLLCFALFDSSHETPLLIHLTDCHWGKFSSFNLFAEFMSRLQTVKNADLTRVLFVFEGRIGELLPNSGDGEGGRDIESWERFMADHLTTKLHVKPLSKAQSNDFLEYVFESSETPYRKVPRSLLINQQTLKNEIVRYAKGNPFHMVEQINLLRQKGVVERNQRTGLFYLAKRSDASYEPPDSIHELIRSRLDFLEANHPEIVTMLCGLGYIKDRVPQELFRHLQKALAPESDLRTLIASEFLEGIDENQGEITFRHENYYQVAHTYELSEQVEDAIAEAYLQWFRKSKRTTPEQQFEQALVLQRSAQGTSEELRSLLGRVINLAESQQQHELSMRALQSLIASYPAPVVETSSIAILESMEDSRVRLAKLASLVGDWKEAARELEVTTATLQELLDKRPMQPEERQRVALKLYRAQIELADSKKNQLHHHKAIKILSEILPELELRGNNDASGEWTELTLWATNRLGVALWFDGRLGEGRVMLAQGLESSRRLEKRLTEYNFLLDYGTLLFHEEPNTGVELLSKALSIVSDPTTPTLPRDEQIIKWQRCLGEILIAERCGGERETLEEIVRHLQEIYLEAERGGYTHETGGAALVLGSCMARLGDESAQRWLLKAISVAHRSNYLEYLWKGHLNLAQFLLGQGTHLIEGAAHHAEQAHRMIVGDLRFRKRSEDKLARMKLFLLPLSQLARIWKTVEDRRLYQLQEEFPGIQKYLLGNGQMREDRWSAEQVLHISHGTSDYFLMN